MTDIQRHLKGIRKILGENLQNPDIEQVKSKLRQYLPKSYGIASGKIVNDSAQSEPIQILLYDMPLAAGKYSEASNVFRIEHVLLILDLVVAHDASSLGASLERIATVKRLLGFRKKAERDLKTPLAHKRRTVPKDRLPFALLYAGKYADYQAGEEGLYRELQEALTIHSLDERPDEILLLHQNLQFLNPLLEHEKSPEHVVSLSQLPDLLRPEYCYVCKQKFFRQHFFYKDICLDCADLNYQKRFQKADLSGYRVLLTGARLKIGYYTSLRLLRAGAEVIATSRFPRDTARRYMEEVDFEDWKDRLHIYGLDLRQIGWLELFVQHLYERFPYIDALINNAAQTVKRPPAFYAHLLPLEMAERAELPEGIRKLVVEHQSPNLQLEVFMNKQLEAGTNPDFPEGQFDEYGQQVDNRNFNSWVMRLDEVPSSEMLEVNLVNAIAPAVLAGQLKGLLKASPHPKRLIINVSAAEGRFAQHKNGYHPHTNMAKAALNMLTRSIADDYARSGILVTSVDPGWVSDQTPRSDDASRSVGTERLPIDMQDAAARICDLLFTLRSSGKIATGKLYKDYRVVDW